MRSTQIPLFTPETEWVMPDELKDLRGVKQIAIDLETNDPNLKELGSGNVTGKGHIAGIAVAVEGWSGYFPIQHESNGNMDKKLVFSWLQDIFNQEDTTFIFHNAMYDICWLRSAGLTIKGKIVDTMIAASLIDENRLSYRLDILAKHYTGVGKDEKILQAAEAYKKEVVAKAEGEASRFLAIYNEYAKAKQVTQERMFLETMETVLGDINKIIIDKNSGSGVVPYLPLPELKKAENN